MRNSSLKRSGMARVKEESHSFTCHPHAHPGHILRIFSNTHMASAGAQAYNVGLVAEPQPPAGVQGQSPRWGWSRDKAPWSRRGFVFKTAIFNGFAWNDV